MPFRLFAAKRRYAKTRKNAVRKKTNQKNDTRKDEKVSDSGPLGSLVYEYHSTYRSFNDFLTVSRKY